MLENKFTASNGVEITYKQKKNKFDFKHLIFVFSGFLNKTPGNYDFINAMSDCPAEVIWINDSFDNMYTYYLCVNMDFKIEEAIKEFMMQKFKSVTFHIHRLRQLATLKVEVLHFTMVYPWELKILLLLFHK